MDEYTVTEAVKNGIAVLDQFGPENWRDKINTDTLDIARPSRCVLQQVFGSYCAGLEILEGAYEQEIGKRLESPVDWRIDQGFIAPGTGWHYGAASEALTGAWIDALIAS